MYIAECREPLADWPAPPFLPPGLLSPLSSPVGSRWAWIGRLRNLVMAGGDFDDFPSAGTPTLLGTSYTPIVSSMCVGYAPEHVRSMYVGASIHTLTGGSRRIWRRTWGRSSFTVMVVSMVSHPFGLPTYVVS